MSTNLQKYKNVYLHNTQTCVTPDHSAHTRKIHTLCTTCYKGSLACS